MEALAKRRGTPLYAKSSCGVLLIRLAFDAAISFFFFKFLTVTKRRFSVAKWIIKTIHYSNNLVF